MADQRSFYDKTKICMPAAMQLLKPTTLAVAILKPGQNPEGPKSEEDYLWIKCAGKTTAPKLYEQCRLKTPFHEEFVLKHGPRVLDLQTPMSEIVDAQDRLVVLEVVGKSELSSRLASDRQPLKPTNHHQLPQSVKSEISYPVWKEKPGFPGLQKLEASGPQDENCPPRSDSRLPVSPHFDVPAHSPQFSNLRDDWHPHNAGVVRSSTPPTSLQHYPLPVAAVPRPSSVALTQDLHEARPQSLRFNAAAGTTSPYSTRRSFVPPTDRNLDSSPASDVAFSRYLAQGLANARRINPDKSEDEVTAILRAQWEECGPIRRAYIAAGASGMPIHKNVEPKALDAEHAFTGRDRSQSHTLAQEEEGQQSFQLQTLLKDAEPEVLETSVEQGVKLLQKLKEPLQAKAQDSPDALQWIQQINNLEKQAVKTKTIIGVVGNTGAGKSSVINAMLDEERLVPTNCMRACTAVVTEISYNHEEQPYRAQVEFISLADWRKELETLFHDLIDTNGAVSKESSNEDTDAGIAYAKIKAVYPRKTKEDIANSSIDNMLREVSHLLGTSKTIGETDSSRFYSRLQHYVDSKEKATGDKKGKKKERRDLEFWPLIRVVRIYVKSPALSTGAVIVDLPGVHDSNAARAAVAEGYMKQCTGLWIVAPTNRAVDDKAAKSLLGESFKRQLKMDGGFNAVTFICSKTDDISLLEAQDSLDLGDELGAQWAEIDRLGRSIKESKKRLDEMKESKSVYSELMNDADDQLEVWDGLKEELEEGKTVFAPTAKSSGRKRKAKGSRKLQKKRRITSDSENDESEDEDYDDEETNDESESTDETTQPLTEEQLSTRIAELKANRKKARHERTALEDKIKALGMEIKTSQAKENSIEADIAAKCIAGRNQYSKGAIQQDFAAGIKELDQELAAEGDEENFNPDLDARDYTEVARSLKCFCVSSRAYQKLSGRLQKDPAVPGFQTVDETEMPQLQAHCKELTKAGRSANCRRFINNLSQLLNSLALWASSDGTGENLSTEQREREAELLSSNLKKLEDGLDKTVASTCKDLGEEFGDNIFDKYATAVSNAIREASNTACKWGAPVNRENRAAGGVHFMTYRAICRRNGAYTNAQGPYEWNVQLSEPMIKVLAAGWEKTFTRRTPMVMAGFARDAADLLMKFHHDIDSRARKIGLGIAGLHALKQQLSVYESILKDVSKEAADTVNKSQKEINREFVPVIERAMVAAYEMCVEERGVGSYARMKSAMLDHVDQQRHSMFQRSVDEVRQQLKKMTKHLESRMNAKTDEVFVSIQRDYRAVLGGGAPQGELLPKSQRLTRKEVLRIVDGAEAHFRKIAAGEPLEDDQGGISEDDNSHQLGPQKDQPLECDGQVKPKPSGSSPREDDSSSGEDNSTSVKSRTSQSIKPEPKEDQPLTDAAESPEGTSDEAALPSVEVTDKPTLSKDGSGDPRWASSAGGDHGVQQRVRGETPDALDAQLNTAWLNRDPSDSSHEDEDSD